jgi:hypothetical protein
MGMVKASVEASNLRHTGQAFEDRLNCGQIVRLMKGSERNQLMELCQDLPADDRWAKKSRSAMNNTVTNT